MALLNLGIFLFLSPPEAISVSPVVQSSTPVHALKYDSQPILYKWRKMLLTSGNCPSLSVVILQTPVVVVSQFEAQTVLRTWSMVIRFISSSKIRRKNIHVKQFSDRPNWTKIILQVACGGH